MFDIKDRVDFFISIIIIVSGLITMFWLLFT